MTAEERINNRLEKFGSIGQYDTVELEKVEKI